MKNRILHIAKIPNSDDILAGDNRGVLFKLDKELNILASSAKMYNSSGLHVLIADTNFVYARDTTGNICRWDVNTLEPLDFICSEYFTNCKDDDKPPMPVPASALALWRDKLITVNSRGEVISFNKNSMIYEGIIDFPSDSFAECIMGNEETPHLISDCSGVVWSGDFNSGTFTPLVQTNHGNSHCIRFDRRHDRFWATTDTYGGFWIFNSTGKVLHRIKMTNDDIEWLEFNQDYSKAFLACFDHYLYVYSNLNDLPEVTNKIGPFKFMLKQVLILNDDDIYILLQSGEIYHYSLKQNRVVKEIFGTNCVWSIQSISNTKNIVCCAMEDGSIALVRYGYNEYCQYDLSILSKSPNFNFGVIRKVVSLDSGGYLCATESGVIFRCDLNYKIQWKIQLGYLSRDIDIDKNQKKCLTCSDDGDLCEIDITSGKIINNKKYGKPVYSVCYDYKGHIYFATRIFSDFDESDNFDACTSIQILNEECHQQIKEIPIGGNVKRMQRLADGHLMINGNGGLGVTIIDTNTHGMKYQFNEWLLNTTENAILVDGKLYAITYGYQLNTYKYDDNQSILDSQFTPDDYPKSLHSITEDMNIKLLLVGGRGFLSLYDVTLDTPRLVRTKLI